MYLCNRIDVYTTIRMYSNKTIRKSVNIKE